MTGRNLAGERGRRFQKDEQQVTNELWGLRNRKGSVTGGGRGVEVGMGGGGGKAGARLYYLLGHSRGFGLYPSVTTSNGRLSRVER